ncbi:B12 binding domain of Methylmalonyl-CoA mutase [Halanaerobium saccharolyticum subsp. saccharolyticum DSM 6643]|uniref:B12 binding domain of Methylmalonyl-CoA mutase n=1 Tax=Halanaerobium saccharolyticum subsp. saccharolyticum DSM 6643 TaxID=1293054 RepID=M5E2K2_9FIRM|nr:cobalamin B12-binding domain-containing protein [Halanaerobium saccharolyticum]CCU80213.1 B12 binding domain of Methylmalonyl-CoA mutase [Halanaerobium saccharolyticum subsp. saccharolyticum DSM 6643]
MSGKKRVLIAKLGLDGHDRGAKIVARALKEAGMEVIYTGLRNTAEEVVRTALQEDVDIIGVSILSGAHKILVQKLFKIMEAENINDTLVIVGGIIPKDDYKYLKELGVNKIFGSGTSIKEILNYLND